MLSCHNSEHPVNDAPLPSEAGAAEHHSTLVQHAFTAIDAAASVEDVKKVLHQWTGLTAYARAAKDKQLEADATEIKMRAERHGVPPVRTDRAGSARIVQKCVAAFL
jgi:hypothetical protein